jgi:hypothetical protein
VDPNDVALSGQEVSQTLPALGLANFDQAARILKVNLDKSIRGNTYVEFETSVKSFGVRPGDLITVTYLKEGFTRQPFRIVKIAPGVNHRVSTITAQIHDDSWYADSNGQVTSASGGRRAWNSDGQLVGDSRKRGHSVRRTDTLLCDFGRGRHRKRESALVRGARDDGKRCKQRDAYGAELLVRGDRLSCIPRQHAGIDVSDRVEPDSGSAVRG